MKKIRINLLKQLWEYLSLHNSMAPFPVYCTEYVGEVKNTIDKMEQESDKDYDDMPVTACTYCKSLHITVDDLDNDVCMRCGSVNEIVTYSNIKEYLGKHNEDN